MRATWVVVLAGCGRVGFDAFADAAAGPTCGATPIFQEPFTATLDATWIQKMSTNYSIASGTGHVAFKFPANAAANTFAEIDQRAAFDARGTCTTFQLLAPPNGARTFVRLHSPPGDIEYRWRIGLLEAALNGPATRSVTYDATKPFLQLQESAGVVYFATAASASGPFAPFAAEQPDATQFDASTVQIELGIATQFQLLGGDVAQWGPIATVGP